MPTEVLVAVLVLASILAMAPAVVTVLDRRRVDRVLGDDREVYREIAGSLHKVRHDDRPLQPKALILTSAGSLIDLSGEGIRSSLLSYTVGHDSTESDEATWQKAAAAYEGRTGSTRYISRIRSAAGRIVGRLLKAHPDAILIAPRSIAELMASSGLMLRPNVVVIVDLTEAEETDLQRMLDFLDGVVFGVGGSIQRAARRTFVVRTPRRPRDHDNSSWPRQDRSGSGDDNMREAG